MQLAQIDSLILVYRLNLLPLMILRRQLFDSAHAEQDELLSKLYIYM